MQVLSECVICKGESLVKYGKARDYLVSDQEFSIMQCEGCGFVFTNPRPDDTEMDKYYHSEDYISHQDAGKSILQKIYKTVRRYMLARKIQLIRRNWKTNEKPRVLDYGCATGEFLKKAREAGWDTTGFEPSENARKVAISKGLDVYGNYDELENKIKPGSIDIITLWHVLEHIGDPVEKIKLFSMILKDDGLIVVAVPQYLCFDGKYYKEKWAAWDVPRHLNHFDLNTMKIVFSKAGFNFKGTFPLIFDAFYIALLSEQHRNTKLTRIPRAIWIGLLSNFNAWTGKYPYSSMIYVFRKAR